LHPTVKLELLPSMPSPWDGVSGPLGLGQFLTRGHTCTWHDDIRQTHSGHRSRGAHWQQRPPNLGGAWGQGATWSKRFRPNSPASSPPTGSSAGSGILVSGSSGTEKIHSVSPCATSLPRRMTATLWASERTELKSWLMNKTRDRSGPAAPSTMPTRLCSLNFFAVERDCGRSQQAAA
jgi:hypothetical protein